MESNGKQQTSTWSVVAIGATVMTACALTFLCTAWAMRPQCATPMAHVNSRSALQLPHDRVDLVDRIHDNGVTAIKAYGVDKCFILSGDSEAMSSAQRVLTVVGQAMDEEQMAELYGFRIASFCEGRLGYVVRVSDGENNRVRRQAEDTVTPVALGPSTDSGGRHTNECQNSQVIDCGGDEANAVYKCNTGPALIYRANIVCQRDENGAHQIQFSLTKRCSKYKETAGVRFLKCIQRMLQGRQGEQIEEDD